MSIGRTDELPVKNYLARLKYSHSTRNCGYRSKLCMKTIIRLQHCFKLSKFTSQLLTCVRHQSQLGNILHHVRFLLDCFLIQHLSLLRKRDHWMNPVVVSCNCIYSPSCNNCDANLLTVLGLKASQAQPTMQCCYNIIGATWPILGKLSSSRLKTTDYADDVHQSSVALESISHIWIQARSQSLLWTSRSTFPRFSVFAVWTTQRKRVLRFLPSLEELVPTE